MMFSPYTQINSGNVAVAADFCGIAMHSWPSTGLVSGPINIPNNVRYKHTIIDDWQSQPNGTSYGNWSDIETSSGVFDWSNIDIWAAGHSARGVNLTFQVAAMPAFYSTNSATVSSALSGNGKPARYGVGGPLNSAGSGLTFSAGVSGGFYNFIFQLVTRYKNKGTPLKYLHLLTEADFPTSAGTGMWWGSFGDLVDYCYYGYAAAKAADPTITVMSPSVTRFGVPAPDYFVTQAGTVNTGVQGYQTYDQWGIDLYNVGPQQCNWTNIDITSPVYRTRNPYDLVYWVSYLRTKMGANVKPIAFCNLNVTDGTGGYTMLNFVKAQTPLWRKQWVARSMLTAAALGVVRCCMWNYDHYVWTGSNIAYYFMDYVGDTDGVIAGFNEIADNVAGKTIVTCGYRGDGFMFASFSDGSNYSI